jgi:hypothetical protein
MYLQTVKQISFTNYLLILETHIWLISKFRNIEYTIQAYNSRTDFSEYLKILFPLRRINVFWFKGKPIANIIQQINIPSHP